VSNPHYAFFITIDLFRFLPSIQVTRIKESSQIQNKPGTKLAAARFGLHRISYYTYSRGGYCNTCKMVKAPIPPIKVAGEREKTQQY
jgi:hypothetical protein